jgi:hypothetical protein
MGAASVEPAPSMVPEPPLLLLELVLAAGVLLEADELELLLEPQAATRSDAAIRGTIAAMRGFLKAISFTG